MSETSSPEPHAAPLPYTHSRRHRRSRELLSVHKQGAIYDVAPDVIGLKTGIVNLYFIGAPGSADWVLIDTGLPGHGSCIRQIAERRFGRGVPPKAILLTHAHGDHVGSLRNLLRIWDVPVYAHRTELPFITGRADYAPADPTVGGGFIAWSSFLMPKRGIDIGSHAQGLPANGEIPGLPGWRTIETPGHSPGHVSFFRETDRLLIAGDAVVTVQEESFLANLTLTPVVQRPPAYFTPDWPAAKISIGKLAELNPSIVATGHGKPLYGEAMRRALGLLAYEFERHPYGLPSRGRYRDVPALFDPATGCWRLPPAPITPYLIGILAVIFATFFVTTVSRFAHQDRSE